MLQAATIDLLNPHTEAHNTERQNLPFPFSNYLNKNQLDLIGGV